MTLLIMAVIVIHRLIRSHDDVIYFNLIFVTEEIIRRNQYLTPYPIPPSGIIVLTLGKGKIHYRLN